MNKYTLSPQAQKSLVNIKGYSLSKFGETKTHIYIKQLRNAFIDIAHKPLIGIPRDDIKPGYFCKIINSHIIFYKLTESKIQILDVLHQKMDYTRYL